MAEKIYTLVSLFSLGWLLSPLIVGLCARMRRFQIEQSLSLELEKRAANETAREIGSKKRF